MYLVLCINTYYFELKFIYLLKYGALYPNYELLKIFSEKTFIFATCLIGKRGLKRFENLYQISSSATLKILAPKSILINKLIIHI